MSSAVFCFVDQQFKARSIERQARELVVQKGIETIARHGGTQCVLSKRVNDDNIQFPLICNLGKHLLYAPATVLCFPHGTDDRAKEGIVLIAIQ